MPEQDLGTGQLQEAEEVRGMVFPAGHQAARVVKPGEEAFDFPAATIAAKGPPILGHPTAPPVRRDHLDAVLRAELRIEAVAVVAAIADQARRQLAEEAGVEGGGDEVALIR